MASFGGAYVLFRQLLIVIGYISQCIPKPMIRHCKELDHLVHFHSYITGIIHLVWGQQTLLVQYDLRICLLSAHVLLYLSLSYDPYIYAEIILTAKWHKVIISTRKTVCHIRHTKSHFYDLSCLERYPYAIG